ncbi:[F-actin]-monooxygenase MICAL2 (Molecule interacting with CasL protein 2) (MICAL-2) [Durusdinium trenchii]|uniref:[F-actin]-monooxygenase MICAL2 (Molecule interacting with CasL protein 2) (MICAL-2) n=1 Tax=Durusdinium trenchii TaxID=1381693 RepID=A0ABP0QXW8_9DINO
MGPGLGLLSGRGRPLRGMNILKLWDWATSDLLDLGAKHLLPSFLSYMDRDVVLGNGHGCLLGEADHIGIRELQALLLKLCLLMKVQISWQTSFKAVEPSVASGVQLVTRRVGPGEGVEETNTFSSVIACDGGRSKVAEHLGLARVRADGSADEPRSEIAVVVNFANHREPEDRLLEECPRGFNDEISLVRRLIYLQGETHYFIMTVDMDVLLKHEVIPSRQELSKVNPAKLEAFAREVVELYSAEVRRIYQENDGAFGMDIPTDFWSRRPVALDPKGRPAMSVFAYHADLTWLQQPMHLFDDQRPVFFAGDALREPFWPMGEGCSRGFMGALDTVWAVRCWAKGLRGQSLLQLRKRLFDLASKVDPANYGKDVFLPFEHPVPLAGFHWLSALRISWPAWGLDGRRRPTTYAFTVDPKTRYISYEEPSEPLDLEDAPSVAVRCTLCSR